MPGLNIPNTIDVNTTADAVEVEQNFSVIESYVNHDLIRSDGGVAMNAPLLLNAGDPTESDHAANKNYVDALMPIGTIMMFAGDSAPAGDWHLCDGTSLAVASYPHLYAQLGVRYGGAGATFNLPNFQGRMPVGKTAARDLFNTTGKTGGSNLVPIPSHSHTINHDHGSATSGAASDSSFTTSSAGNHDHDISYTSDAATTGAGARLQTYVSGGLHTLTGGDGNHTHTVATPHTHSVNLGLHSGNSGAEDKSINLNLATGGVLGPVVNTTTELIPPFVVVNYIIRVDPQ